MTTIPEIYTVYNVAASLAPAPAFFAAFLPVFSLLQWRGRPGRTSSRLLDRGGVVRSTSTLECRRRRAACCGTRHRAGHHQYPHPHTRRAPSPGWSFICFSASGFLWRPSIRSAPRFYFPVVSCLSLSKLSAATCFCSRAITAAHASGPTEASSQAASVSTVPNGSK